MKPIHVHGGVGKGRKVKISETHSSLPLNFTPANLKKAIFSIINSELESNGMSWVTVNFYDLFCGSGQMGIEAISLGSANTYFFDLSIERLAQVKETLADFGGNYVLHKKDSLRIREDFFSKGNAHIFFCDPPYSFWKGNRNGLEKLYLELCKVESGMILFQAPSEILKETDKQTKFWQNSEIRKYGSHVLIIRRFA